MRPLISFAHTILWTLAACGVAFGGNHCEQLASFSAPEVEITTTAVVAAGVFTPPTGKALGGLPPFCRVAALLHPSADSAIRIELWMPETNWNGRLEGTGNGGFAGNLAYGALAEGSGAAMPSSTLIWGWLLRRVKTRRPLSTVLNAGTIGAIEPLTK